MQPADWAPGRISVGWRGGILSLEDLEWNLLRFVSLLAGPGLVYFLACTLIPDEPAFVGSWRAYFYRVRRQYFIGLSIWSVLQMINTSLLLEMPLLHPLRVVQLLLLTMGIVGAASDDPRIQRMIAIGSWLIAAIASITLFLPGSLAT